MTPTPDTLISTSDLPVDLLLPELRAQLNEHISVLLSAEPGAGKTTRVPLALLNEPWLRGQKIIMLEPRRLAARNAARFMAQQLNEQTGETVGYRIRLEQKISATTRIEVVTEGILTRMLQDDPELNGVGLIIFDEFHERNLHSDLALALAHQCQQLLRPELRLLVMSATLDADSLGDKLQAPLLHSSGRGFAVKHVYRPLPDSNRRLAEHCASVVREALNNHHEGDVLVFLPGVADIRRVQTLLESTATEALVVPLHGQLNDSEQKTALAPAPAGLRKVILATNIAESSLTIDGVRIVVDSGLERRMSFSPATGISQLQTRTISQASSIQRAGRAGRQAEGFCYRLWREEEQSRREPHIRADILDADLAPLLLELLHWGADLNDLLWLTPPPAASLKQAQQVLAQLGMLQPDAPLRLNEHGQRCAAFGLEPRWAHALLCAQPLGMAAEACELVAVLQEWPHQQRHSDDAERLLSQARRQSAAWNSRIRPLAQRFQRQLPTTPAPGPTAIPLDCALM
ncbi:MAG: ATP-dependent helicase HrpB, partial [Saccharospirillaceae bacterium]|nr:ATP-dependent helicase HrpB [Saccharospirillaceae bacterium]